MSKLTFIDEYLREYEENILSNVIKNKKIFVKKEDFFDKKTTIKKQEKYFVCSFCGQKHSDIILKEMDFCSKCGKKSLVSSDKFVKSNKAKTCISHASELLDESSDATDSEIQRMIKSRVKDKSSSISEASALLDEDTPVMEIPMPDFSKYMTPKKQVQQTTTQVEIPPELQIIQPININDAELDKIVHQNLGKGV